MMFGTVINWIIGASEGQAVSLRVWATIILGCALLVTWLQSYSFLEKTQMAIVSVLLVGILASAVSSHPDLTAALKGVLVPIIPEYERWVVEKYPSIAARPPWVEVITYMGALGGGVYDYVGYLGMTRDKGWSLFRYGALPPNLRQTRNGPVALDLSEENVRRGTRWLWPVFSDVSISFLCVFVFTVAFMTLGAAILHPQELVPSGMNLLSYQAQFLTRFHPGLLYLYQVGILFAIGGTVFAGPEIYVRTTYECLLPLVKTKETLDIRRVRIWVIAYCGVSALALIWMGLFWSMLDNPVKVVTPAAIIGGVFGCGLWCFGAIWADKNGLPKQLRMRPGLKIGVFVSGVVLTLLGLKAILDFVF